MSPEVNTASRYIHMPCTWIQISSCSDTVENLLTHTSTSARKGVMYLLAAIEPRFIMVSWLGLGLGLGLG